MAADLLIVAGLLLHIGMDVIRACGQPGAQPPLMLWTKTAALALVFIGLVCSPDIAPSVAFLASVLIGAILIRYLDRIRVLTVLKHRPKNNDKEKDS